MKKYVNKEHMDFITNIYILSNANLVLSKPSLTLVQRVFMISQHNNKLSFFKSQRKILHLFTEKNYFKMSFASCKTKNQHSLSHF